MMAGSYVLVLRLASNRSISIGHVGQRVLPAGRYMYCGSALGPGGLSSRLARHRRPEKRLHWHIDYFLEHAAIEGIWVINAQTRLECAVARSLCDLGCVPIAGVGASDCRCVGHLLLSTNALDLDTFGAALHARDASAPLPQLWVT